MTAYLAGLDAAIAKALEFAEASKEAEDAVSAMALAADDAAVVVGAAMATATASVHGLRDAYLGAAAAAGGLRGASGDLGNAGGIAATDAALARLASIELELGVQTQILRASLDAMRDTTATLTLGLTYLDNRLIDIAGASTATAAGVDRLSGQFRDLTAAMLAAAAAGDVYNIRVGGAGRAAARAGAGAAAAAVGFRLFGFGIGLGATAIHGIISGLIEFLAVAIPATVAAAAFGFVWVQGATNIYQHLNALFTATEALGQASGQTYGEMLGLSGAFQRAQDAANPQVYQALGSALLVLREKFSDLAQTGLEVGRIFDTFAAKVVYDFSPQGGMGGAMDAVLAKMVTDLVQFGQVAGNLGHAILELGAKMPGAANLLLDFVVGVTKLIVAMSELPRPIIYAAFALHELNTWGSVAVAMMGRMGLVTAATSAEFKASTASFFGFTRAIMVLRALLGVVPVLITAFGTALVRVGDFLPVFGAEVGAAGDAMATFGAEFGAVIAGLSGGWILAIAAIAVGLSILIDKMVTAKDGTQQFADSLQSVADKASNLKVLGDLASNMTQLSLAEHNATQGAGTLAEAQRKGGGAVRAWASAQMAAGPALQVLRASMQSTAAQIQAVTSHAQFLAATYHTSFYGGLLLADEAGVKLNKTLTAQQWAIAQIKIASLAAGYQAMGQSAGAVGADMTALAIQSGLAGTKMSQLNQAWDAFMQDITGGTGALAAFDQSLTGLTTGANTVTNILGKAGQVTLSMKDFAQSLTSFSGKGAQAWQNFNQVVGSSAPQLIDWLRTAGAMGVLGGGQFSQAILGMTSQLIPFAAKSKTAQAEVLALAQQAGLGITSFDQLKRQVKDSGASISATGKIVSQATIAMGNMAQVAQNLGTVVGSLVTTAMAKAALSTSGYYKAVLGLDQAIRTYGADSPQAVSAAAKVTAAQGQVNSMLSSNVTLLHTEQALLNALHDKTITLRINTVYSTTGGGPLTGGGKVQYAAGTDSAQRGPALVGEKGPELVWMSGGEHVLTAHHTKALLSLAGSVRGYAAGTQSSHALMDQLTRELSVLAARLLAASSISGIGQYVHNLLATIKQLASAGTISKSAESDVVTLVDKDNKRLDHLFNERAKILAKIRKADQYAAAVSQAAQSTASLSTIMQGAGGAPVSSSYLLASMRINLAGIRRFDSDIKRLEKMGLDRALLNQIIQMGPAQGDQVAQALINGPLSNIKALNATESQVQKASKNLGRTTADRMFDAGKYAGKGFLSGLEGEQHAIERLMEKIARDMVRTLKHELGIKSPSSVTRGIAHDLMDGFPLGVADRLPSLDSSLRSAAGHVTSALSSAAGGGHGGGDIVVHNHVMVPLPSSRQQWQEIQTQSLRVARRNPDNRLSLTRGRGGRQ